MIWLANWGRTEHQIGPSLLIPSFQSGLGDQAAISLEVQLFQCTPPEAALDSCQSKVDTQLQQPLQA